MKKIAENHQKRKNPIPFWKRIRFKLITSFLIPVIFIIILGVVSYQKATTQIISTYEESVEQTMTMMNQYLTLAFDTVQSNYKGYVNDEGLQRFYSGLYDNDTAMLFSVPTAYDDTFTHSVTTDALISNIYVLSDSHSSITTTKTKEEGLLSAFMETSQGQILSSDKVKYYLFGNQSPVDEKLNTTSAQYGVRLARHFTNAPAILIVDIKRSVIEDTLSSLNGGEGSIVGFITCDNTEYLSSLSAAAEGNIFIGKSYVEDAFQSEQQTGASYVENAGYLFLYSKIDGRNAMICALIPTENILGQTSDIKHFSIALVAAASFIAILSGSLLAKQYGGAIYDIIRKIKKVSNGDLTVEIRTKRRDEFRLLSEGIADMLSHMKELVTGLKEVNEELSNAASDMSSASEHFLHTSKHIQSEIAEMQQGIEKLDGESEDCLHQMDALSGSIEKVTDNSGQINTLARGTGQAITTGMTSVEQLKSSTGSTIQITSNIISTIEKLADKSKSIGTIIEAINEIAEQTNLLSLNASIEASKAGSAGRGFAVVAQEIKKLADESIHSSDQIVQIVNEIAENTKEATEVARQAESIINSQNQAVSLTAEAFQQIDTRVKGLLDALNQINTGIIGMEDERSTTLSSISAISAVSAQTAAGSSNVRIAAAQQLDSIEELDKAANLLESRARELAELLAGFQV